MTTLLTWLFIAAFLLAGVVTVWERRHRTRAAQEQFVDAGDFDLLYVALKDQTAVGIDTNRQVLLLADERGREMFGLDRLSAVEVVVNGVVVGRTTRASGREEIERRDGNPTMLPDRIIDLILRVTLDDRDADPWDISYLRHTKYFRDMEGVRTRGLKIRGREAREAIGKMRAMYDRLGTALRAGGKAAV